MSTQDQDKWNRIYSDSTSNESPHVARVLFENAHLLPKRGVALDLACGRGGNALFLSKQGLTTHAWDVSSTVLEQLQSFPEAKSIQTCVFDAEREDLPIEQFDVIVVSRFLHRPLLPQLVDALKPEGLLYYQTFIADKAQNVGPNRADYLLQPNELLNRFREMKILVYREEGLTGDQSQGFRNEALLVAQKIARPQRTNRI